MCLPGFQEQPSGECVPCNETQYVEVIFILLGGFLAVQPIGGGDTLGNAMETLSLLSLTILANVLAGFELPLSPGETTVVSSIVGCSMTILGGAAAFDAAHKKWSARGKTSSIPSQSRGPFSKEEVIF